MRGGVRRRETCRLSRKEVVPLLVPHTRQRFGQPFELQHLGLSAVEDGFDDVRGEERQAEQPVDELRVTPLCFGQFPSRSVPALLQQPLPPMRPRQRADQRVVRPWFRRPGIVGLGGVHCREGRGLCATLIPSWIRNCAGRFACR